MGFFDSIGEFFSDAAEDVAGFIAPIVEFAAPVAGIAAGLIAGPAAGQAITVTLGSLASQLEDFGDTSFVGPPVPARLQPQFGVIRPQPRPALTAALTVGAGQVPTTQLVSDQNGLLAKLKDPTTLILLGVVILGIFAISKA